MKNTYSFKLLANKQHCCKPDKNALFFAMLELTEAGATAHPIATLDALEKALPDGHYHVAHNVVSRKGKTVYLDGEMVITRKDDLIMFLKQSAAINDLRDLLIAPTFSGAPAFVVSLYDESFHLYR
ncbi:hypothetical protein G3435_16065 [Pseudomonas sp. MAFF212428]|uniref:Uncharacterized protein n=1 Tax=Pseudomonas brassicae TaxID=2708063 RepID=A0A6B3NQS6_9PSED|nr:hypothetical protein [Pseudomonas brassicae]NER61079.1 hypothetical protein [Pseudomonas brassicae]NER62788.1 hypothetical protein [Pseudomonas brassicae]